jgi:hypothetical protein
MVIDNWTKLAVCIMVCCWAGILGFYGRIDAQAVVALLSAVLGYVFGNAHGVLSASNQIYSRQATGTKE